MEIVRETIASPGYMLKDKAMASSIFQDVAESGRTFAFCLPRASLSLPIAEILPTLPIDPQNPLPRICDFLPSYDGRAGGTDTNRATAFKCPVISAIFIPDWRSAGKCGLLMRDDSSVRHHPS